MNNMNSNPGSVSTPAEKDFEKVLQRIRQTRQKVFAQANTDLIELYWQIGETISHKVDSSGWGKGVVSELARYIVRTDPEIKGFSDKNLWRMKQFYETYRDAPKLSPLVRELPWTQNTIIFSRCKSHEEREYYLRLCIQDRYTSRELERQINASQFERAMLGKQKLSAVLREMQPVMGQSLKDSYVLEFLGLPDDHELVENFHRFSRRTGRDIGKQYAKICTLLATAAL